MATVDDIDTKAAVSKYLDRRVVTPAEDETADPADETQAVLESIAISFLLYPQAALSVVLRSKNTLQQTIQLDLRILDFLSEAIKEFDNPDEHIEDTSDLVEAQTALFELDRIGRVSSNIQAYNRYQAAVNRFLDKGLARLVKRNNKREFERSGSEAKQDALQALTIFSELHALVVTGLSELSSATDDFQSVDLARIVTGRTLTRVRSSLVQIQRGVNDLSKTVMAVELLSGASALQSLTSPGGVFDATVETGVQPSGRTITADSEPVAATALSSAGPFDLSAVAAPWTFAATADPLSSSPTAYSQDLPVSGAGGRVFVTSSEASAAPTYVIPASTKLYLEFTGAGTPYTEVSLTAGTRTVAQLVSEIDAAIAGKGDCVAFGTNQFIIYGAVGVTKITVLADGKGSVVAGVYTPPSESGHSILGFAAYQASAAVGVFTSDILRQCLAAVMPLLTFATDGDRLRISSKSTAPESSLSFGTGVASNLGFSGTVEALPPSILLKEKGQVIDPQTLGVFIGSQVTLSESLGTPPRSLVGQTVTGFSTSLGILFDSTVLLPRGIGLSITVQSPSVSAVSNLTTKLKSSVGTLDRDASDLQRAMAPLFGAFYNQAQINDANRQIAAIRAKLTNDQSTGVQDTLKSVAVRGDRDGFGEVAGNILTTLEERGLDFASDLLRKGRFSQFFALSKERASASGRFLKAAEEVARNDLPFTTVEEDLEEGNFVQGSNDQDLLPGAEPSS